VCVCVCVNVLQVGGPFFTAALKNMKPSGRIAVCGAIATYNDTTPQMCKSHFYGETKGTW